MSKVTGHAGRFAGGAPPWRRSWLLASGERRGAGLLALLLLLGALACAPPVPESQGPAYDREGAWRRLGLTRTEREVDQALQGLQGVTLDPPPVVGRDYNPTFPPDLPFDPSQWKTSRPGPSVAEPGARRGGILRLPLAEYPPTLRTEGPNSRLKTLSDIHNLIYETLLGYDMVLGDYVPRLATHWQIGPDKRTFRFRLNPRARWADGRPVTADDVQATFEHLLREDRKDPLVAELYGDKIEAVRVLDRYTVEIRGKRPEWDTMLLVATQTKIYPAAYIRMDGETYLTEWNWRLPPGSGPYELRPEDLVKGRSITVRRRSDWWDQDNPNNLGMYNFEAVRWEVILDEELTYQKFLAGELDALMIMRAQRWVDEVDREKPVQMGWVQKRKIYTLEPQGYGGYCFNLRTPPFNDRNVRLAFAHLFNRELLFEKFFFYQYEYIDSYFPGQIYARPRARRVEYNPRKARQLLAESGWIRRDSQGFLVNRQGQRFPTLTLEFSNPGFERIHQVMADELWQQAGIKMNLKLVNGASLLKKVWEYQFTVTFFNWTASLFPDMEPQFASRYADAPQSNNLNGYKNPQADRIMDAYRYEFDLKKRIAMYQRLDEILFNDHPYALAWYAPYFRVLYWDKFGHPPEYTDRYTSDLNCIIRYWWIDEERMRRTENNKARGVANYPGKELNQYDAVEHTWWLSHELPMTSAPLQPVRETVD